MTEGIRNRLSVEQEPKFSDKVSYPGVKPKGTHYCTDCRRFVLRENFDRPLICRDCETDRERRILAHQRRVWIVLEKRKRKKAHE